mmetsp:Transcript_34272/g.114403  ORF Transcript_34272/g.114403 Transcript_34272/m.114403 type:complete len:531 (+) Transcript_34272:35-1627(+)
MSPPSPPQSPTPDAAGEVASESATTNKFGMLYFCLTEGGADGKFWKIKLLERSGLCDDRVQDREQEISPPTDKVGAFPEVAGILRSLTNNMKDNFAGERRRTIVVSAFADMLLKTLDTRNPAYRSFACIMATAMAGNIHIGTVRNVPSNRVIAGFQRYMNILFSTVLINKHLVESESANIYHVAHAMADGSALGQPFLLACFCFMLQVGLVSYVILSLVQNSDVFNVLNGVLGLLVLAFSVLYVDATITKHRAISRTPFWGRWSTLRLCDLMANVVIPLVLLPVGFLLIVQSEGYVDAVLNATALLFIPALDDELPRLAGIDVQSVIQNFLVAVAIKELEETVLDNSASAPPATDAERPKLYDHALTGTSPLSGSCTPYLVRTTLDSAEPAVFQSSIATPECLFSRIEFDISEFIVHRGGEAKQQPFRIKWMRLTRLSGEVVEFKHLGIDHMQKIARHELTGCILMTEFLISAGIIRLRVLRADTPAEFLSAMEQYALFDVNSAACTVLKKAQRNFSARLATQSNPTALL